MEHFWAAYIPNKSDREVITATPINATVDQLRGLPDALIITAESDILRDEGEAYARMLCESERSRHLLALPRHDTRFRDVERHRGYASGALRNRAGHERTPRVVSLTPGHRLRTPTIDGMSPQGEITAMNTFDRRKMDVLLTMAWLGAIAESEIPPPSTSVADPSRLEQEALQRMRRALTRATRISRLGELASSIVHEVNQPLTAIRLNGETGLRWLDGEHPSVDRARTLMERMIQDAARALDIVALIRTIAGGRATQQAILNLDEIIEDAARSLQHELRSNDVVITFDLKSSPSRISGNQLQLQQLVVNLLINAMHALANSGTDFRRVAVRTETSVNGNVRCSIEDSGPGIDPSHFAHLFEDVFTTKTTGIGVGLLIIRSIVEAHNNSSLGGARFIFTLPILGESQAAPKFE
jgi:signal transduction histidine kinase